MRSAVVPCDGAARFLRGIGHRGCGVRWSRSFGLPPPLPDIQGLALRIEAEGNAADFELASTGAGVPLRFGLLLHRNPARAHFGSLFPYRGDQGPRLIGARTLAPRRLRSSRLDIGLGGRERRLRLYVATPLGKWLPFAEMALRATGEGNDPRLRFDADRHSVPGGCTYEWVRALRQPSYRLAQGDTPHTNEGFTTGS